MKGRDCNRAAYAFAPGTLGGPYRRRRSRTWLAVLLVLLACLLPVVPHIAAALAAWLHG